jgi:two-component system, NtrC family, response regulator AtoC
MNHGFVHQPHPQAVGGASSLLGESAAINTVRLEIENAARTHAKVLILGETGVGKEVVARLIHCGSPRSRRPFIAVNCSGIPETLLASELFGHTKGSFTGAYRDKIGLVRQADSGTLFLDELGEMSLPMQAMLLRFTETGEIQAVGADRPNGRTDVRLITATNRDLRAQIASGAFREDLFYRLNVIQIRIPPLRERGDDVLLLFRHYLALASQAHGVAAPQLTSDAAQLLLSYQWPGNVRELRNMTERLVLYGFDRPIAPNDLPTEVTESAAGARASGAVAVNHTLAVGAPSAPAAVPDSIVDRIWTRLTAGEDFWTAVQQPFRLHELTRADLAALVDRGLQHTHGSYRALVKLFNMPPEDYKRFHAFLYQQNCNLPVGPYRNGAAKRVRLRGAQLYDVAC